MDEHMVQILIEDEIAKRTLDPGRKRYLEKELEAGRLEYLSPEELEAIRRLARTGA